MRISLKGDKGVYSRGADDSSDDEGGDEWMTAAGTSYLDAYPRELSQSLKKLALSTQLREGADKEKTSALLGRPTRTKPTPCPSRCKIPYNPPKAFNYSESCKRGVGL